MSDHAAAVERVLGEGTAGSEIYNIGGEEHANLDVTRRIVELTGCDPALVRHVEDRPGHDRRYAVDDAKVRSWAGPGFIPSKMAFAATVAWYRDNRSWWEPIKSGEYRAYCEEQYAARLAAE
jgi:dTDP-glucose 4,6-dehydratase